MKRKYITQCLFALAYSALGGFAYMWMRLSLSMDIAMYPYLKPFMLVVAILAVLACIAVLIIDIRRKNVVRFRDRLIIVLAVLIATFKIFSEFWGFVAMIAGYGTGTGI
jgi:hypothetical protein